MQTFLPYAAFDRSARVLDDKRLGKQRVEALQVLRALHLEGYGWTHHPAVTMWRGHTSALVAYGLAIVDEWVLRGHADRTRSNIAEFVHPYPPASQQDLAERGQLPPWLGWRPLHRSHRSALLRKDPGHYGAHFSDTPPDLDYVWPDPPTPPPGRGKHSAWVIRSIGTGQHVAVAARPDEAIDAHVAGQSARMSKRKRQMDRFVHDISPGDLVVVPQGERLRLATIAGGYRLEDHQHIRPVIWRGSIPRNRLRFPAALQDPQDVFRLYDEPGLDREI